MAKGAERTLITEVEATVFKSNRSQAVRLPKAVAFAEGVKRVTVKKVGEKLTIEPVKPKMTWAEFFATGPHVDPDFLKDRAQGEAEEREPF